MFRDDRRPDLHGNRDQQRARALEPNRAPPTPHRAPPKPSERTTPTTTAASPQTQGKPLLGAQPPQARDVQPSGVRQTGVVRQPDVAAALAAMAHGRPAELSEALRTAGGDALAVRFLEQQTRGPALPVWQPLSGAQLTELRELVADHGATWSQLWPAVVEQALDAWRGDAALATPGRSGEVLSALTGQAVRELPTAVDAGQLWQALQEACTNEARPVVTCTSGGDDDGTPPSGHGARPRAFVVHVVTGLDETSAGQVVEVLDPLNGETEQMSLAAFRASYDVVAILPATADD